MTEIELSFREAALCCGRIAMSEFLSSLPETAPQCPVCDEPMKNLGRREKQMVTLLGSCEFKRNYYGCDCASDAVSGDRNREKCRHKIPNDEKLGVAGTKFTQAVQRVTAQIAASDSFINTEVNLKFLCGIDVSAKECERIAEEKGAEIIARRQGEIQYSETELNPPKPEKTAGILYIEYDGTGVPIRKKELTGVKGKQTDGSAKTREMKTGCIFTQSGVDGDGEPIRDPDSATYFSQIDKVDEFGRLLYSEAVKRGVDYAGRVVVIGDGAKWIWNIADDKFPSATQIVDLYHAKEHIGKLLRDFREFQSDPKLMTQKREQLYSTLESGDISSLTSEFGRLNAVTDFQRERVRVESAFFENNAHRMKYSRFKERGLFVGSGVIEAACKNVIGKRIKQSGMFWSVDGANQIAALRCAVLSGEFEPDRLAA
jgi:hypothetical protein